MYDCTGYMSAKQFARTKKDVSGGLKPTLIIWLRELQSEQLKLEQMKVGVVV